MKKQIYASLDEEDILHQNEEDENPGYFETLQAPYIAGFSERLAKFLNCINVGITFRKGHTLSNSFCRLKPPCSHDMRKNVIYCLGCKSCPQVYLGETQQWFPSRYQHNYAIKIKTNINGLAQHVMKIEHMIDWDSTIFLDSTFTGEEGK